ncbi:hypothetical protein [Streptomyces sp. NPDC021608]|uniref:hypothetical protein n=1 Tax=Streptomyces sp. NPDC021608 TaxID=3154903 RepID=UPI0034008761
MIADGEFVVACGNGAAAFQAVDPACDGVPPLVAALVDTAFDGNIIEACTTPMARPAIRWARTEQKAMAQAADCQMWARTRITLIGGQCPSRMPRAVPGRE